MSCKTPKRAEIDATIWLNNSPLPAELCGPKEAEPKGKLWEYGFYRVLDSGGYDFISFCDSDSALWLALHRTDFERLMEKYVPNKK